MPTEFRKIILFMCLLLMLQVSGCAVHKPEPLEYGKGTFVFSNWSGPALNVWYYYPETTTANSNILFVMHGTGRDADRYRDEWIEAAVHTNNILVVPEFSRRDFPKAKFYILGGIYNSEDQLQPANKRTFAAIEPLFDELLTRTVSRQNKYNIYGHSAGSQFVHRYLFFTPGARINTAIAANAGWYTLPYVDQAYPYGIKKTGINKQELQKAFEKNVVILLGDADIDVNDKNLRKTPEALQQGPHRFARGQFFYKQSAEKAKAINSPFNWQIAFVHGADHNNAKMIQAASSFLQQD